MGHMEEAVPVLLWISHTNPGEAFPSQSTVTGQKKPVLSGLPIPACSAVLGDRSSPYALEQVLHLFQEKHPEIWGFVAICNKIRFSGLGWLLSVHLR